MFKTARFKVHNPSRHKRTVLLYALTQYHKTSKAVLESTLAMPDLLGKISTTDKKGRQRVNQYAIAHVIRLNTPKNWGLSPIREYLIGDATAMLLSHFKKQEKGKHDSNLPSLPGLEPATPAQIQEATEHFAHTLEFPIKDQHQKKIEAALAEGRTRVAARLEAIYQNYAVSRASGDVLRSMEGVLPRPIEFTHTEFGRGALLARRGDKYYILIRLFSEGHRYREMKVLPEGMIDWRTGEVLEGKRYPGVILPLELGREYHDQEYLRHGIPRSAKLVVKKDEEGQLDFYVHVAFEFSAEPIEPQTVLGIDRGAAKIGAGCIVNLEGQTLRRGIDLEGAAFSKEMARLRALIAERQRKGLRTGRVMRLRGRRSEIAIGEYANRVVAAALESKAQIVIEKIDATSMSRFLTQSQFTKLRDSLSYKAERVGLPLPIEVPPAYTSQTCAQCGHKGRENRPTQEQFCCVQCGYKANADQNASEIIALRGLHQINKGGRFQKFDAFQTWMRNLGRDNSAAKAASL